MSNATNTTTDAAVSYDKGTWQDTLNQSATLFDRSAKGRKRASALLWQGAKAAIEVWDSGTDASGENLYNELVEVMGRSRKGDASKIKTVAEASARHGLDPSAYPNLSKAYSEAVRLTRTVQQQADEDDAAEKVIETIAEAAPKTASTPESAAAVLLSKGLDGAVVAILDALNGPSGKNNEPAHRAFLRALTTEIAARVQAAKPKPTPKKAATPKKGATPAIPGDGASKAKAKPVVKSASKGDPNKKALPAKGAPVKATPVKAKPVVKAEPVVKADSTDDAGSAKATPVKKKGAPVVRR